MQPQSPPQPPDAAVGLSVVLPAYNERENLESMVGACLEAIEATGLAGEVLVVDDGSTDGTGEMARGLVDAHAGRVRLISHARNLGYGSAIVNGFTLARGEVLFYTDCDHQFDPAELEYVLPALEGNDVVFGYRVYRYDPVMRSLASWVYNRIIRVLFAVDLRDVDCAFKLLRREAFLKIEPESTDFFIDTELAARAGKWGLAIAQKGVRHYPRSAGETTVRASDVPRTLRTVARMWRRIHLPHPDTDRAAKDRRAERLGLAVEYVPSAAAAG